MAAHRQMQFNKSSARTWAKKRASSKMNYFKTETSSEKRIVPGTTEVVVVTPNTSGKKKKMKLTTGKTCSGYNLFYRYSHIVQSSTVNEDEIPIYLFGLERVDIESSPMLLLASEEEINRYRKAEIVRTLQEPESYQGIWGCNDGNDTIGEHRRHRSFAELSKHVGKKWQETDETTKAIFKELAQEIIEQRQLEEYKSFQKVAATDCMIVTPSSVSDVYQSTDGSVNVKSVTSNASASGNAPVTNHGEHLEDNDFVKPLPHRNLREDGKQFLDHLNADWTPLPFDCSIGEMDIFEFDCMLTHFDFS